MLVILPLWWLLPSQHSARPKTLFARRPFALHAPGAVVEQCAPRSAGLAGSGAWGRYLTAAHGDIQPLVLLALSLEC